VALTSFLPTTSYVSPRHRARRTLELLDIGCRDKLPWQDERNHALDIRTNAKVQITEDIREWDYGEYEGITSAQIKERREKAGQPVWDIWRDGCPGGETPAQVTERLDRLIHDIRTRFHDAAIGVPKSDAPVSDVLLVAHGHILRAFAMRWIGRELTEGVALLLEAGGVGTLSYEHRSLHEPAILLGGAFMVDLVEGGKERE
jgi:broad specificity phosphatase PhoE